MHADSIIGFLPASDYRNFKKQLDENVRRIADDFALYCYSISSIESGIKSAPNGNNDALLAYYNAISPYKSLDDATGKLVTALKEAGYDLQKVNNLYKGAGMPQLENLEFKIYIQKETMKHMVQRFVASDNMKKIVDRDFSLSDNQIAECMSRMEEKLGMTCKEAMNGIDIRSAVDLERYKKYIGAGKDGKGIFY